MSFYTDWYEYDYEMDHNKEKVIKELGKLPELMQKDTNIDRPYDSDIGVMLYGLREVYDEYKPNYVVARSIAVILKKLYDLAKTREQYARALNANFSNYLELALSVLGNTSKTLFDIKKYGEALQQNKVGLHAAHNLLNILNIKNLMTGGWNTEYSLYAMHAIINSNSGINTFGESVLDIFEMLSECNFAALNKEIGMQDGGNYDIIIRLIYQMMNTVLEARPYTVSRIKRQKRRLDEVNGLSNALAEALREEKESGLGLIDFFRDSLKLEQNIERSERAIQLKQMQHGGRQ